MEKTFTIECTMEERWVNQFLSFLTHISTLGKIGKSELVSLYADGDGDFRPKFNIQECDDWTLVSPKIISTTFDVFCYDAG